MSAAEVLLKVCTIIAKNYMAHACVLASSLRESHPDLDLDVLVVDIDQHSRDVANGIRPWGLADLGLDTAEIQRLTMIYDVMELSTAVKPWFLLHLLGNGTEPVLYFDPDIMILDRLDALGEAAARSGIALTPHTLSPMPRDGLRPAEAEILGAGVYNLGFVGVGPSAKPFLEWWWERLRWDAISDPGNMLFTDQRWVDLVPGYFEHAIVKDPGYNVAYWNVDQRPLTVKDDKYFAGGAPLRFYHFSGYDPHRPTALSKHMGQAPRILLSRDPILRELCDSYGARLLSCGYDQAHREPYGFAALPNGMPIDMRMRRAYRAALLHPAGSSPPGLPMASSVEADAFVRWLTEREPGSRLSRYLTRMYRDRADLQWAFPGAETSRAQADRFAGWILDDGRRQERIPDALLPAEARDEDVLLQPGINVAGYFRAELGVGEAGRLLLQGLRASSVPFRTLTVTDTVSRQQHPFDADAAEVVYDTTVAAVNADQIRSFVHSAPETVARRTRIVGLWFWELEAFPEALHSAFDHVEEVWAGSNFIRDALQRVSPVPVFTFPLPVTDLELAPGYDARESLGIARERFMFLFVFDFMSMSARKNPVGLVRAFRQAFGNDGPVLVLKSINGDARPLDREELIDAIGDASNIMLVDEYVSHQERNALIAACDCYVSLHRSEGFGLTLAEAMMLGKPVIATGYSGNLDFMGADVALLVPYATGHVPGGCEPYPAGAEWAEPDLGVAAQLMRDVVADPQRAAAMGARAREYLRTTRSPRVAAAFIEERFSALQQRPPKAAAARLEPHGRRSVLRSKIRGAALALRRASRPGVLLLRNPPPGFEGLFRLIRRVLRPGVRLVRRLSTMSPDRRD